VKEVALAALTCTFNRYSLQHKQTDCRTEVTSVDEHVSAADNADGETKRSVGVGTCDSSVQVCIDPEYDAAQPLPADEKRDTCTDSEGQQPSTDKKNSVEVPVPAVNGLAPVDGLHKNFVASFSTSGK